MSSPADIYKRIFAGEKLSIVCNPSAYQSLRTQLCKHHRTAVALDLSDDSICSSYDTATATATYWVGRRRSGKKKFSYTIVEVQDNEEIPRDMGGGEETPEPGSVGES
jgi:hypothetical protein